MADNFNLIFSKRLNKLMQDNNLTQAELMVKMHNLGAHISQQTISKWCKGDAIPRMSKVDALCNIFRISRTQLIGDDDSPIALKYKNISPVTNVSVPMLGSVACGKPIFINEEHQEVIEKPDGIKCDFCLTAKGDSMIDIGIQNNDIVFIKSQDTANNGDIVCVAIDDEATIKKFDYDKLNNKLMLIPCNKSYQTIIYEGEQLDHIHILGKVIYFKRYL